MGGSIGLIPGDRFLLHSAASGLRDFRRRSFSSSLSLRELLDGAIGDPAIWVKEKRISLHRPALCAAPRCRSWKIRHAVAQPSRLIFCRQPDKQKTQENKSLPCHKGRVSDSSPTCNSCNASSARVHRDASQSGKSPSFFPGAPLKVHVTFQQELSPKRSLRSNLNASAAA